MASTDFDLERTTNRPDIKTVIVSSEGGAHLKMVHNEGM